MISVIIPLYNKEQTIVHTLKTVFAQTFSDFEIIIVNDGSTDNSVDAIQSNYSDARLRIINQKNAGVSAARNRGVKEAKSDWVTFLDADDEWQPEYLSTIHQLIVTFPNVNIVGTGGFYKNLVTGNISPSFINRYAGMYVEINYFINPDKMPHIGATAIRKKTFSEVGGFPEGVWCSEDVCLLLKIGLTSSIGYCGIPQHVYVGGVSGQTTSNSRNKKAEKRKCEGRVYNEVYELYQKCYNTNRLVPIFLKYKLRACYTNFLRNNDYESINSLDSYLSNEIKNLLGNIFIKIVPNRNLRLIVLIYLLLTKFKWRLLGNPVVGEKIDNQQYWINTYRPV